MKKILIAVAVIVCVGLGVFFIAQSFLHHDEPKPKETAVTTEEETEQEFNGNVEGHRFVNGDTYYSFINRDYAVVRQSMTTDAGTYTLTSVVKYGIQEKTLNCGGDTTPFERTKNGVKIDGKVYTLDKTANVSGDITYSEKQMKAVIGHKYTSGEYEIEFVDSKRYIATYEGDEPQDTLFYYKARNGKMTSKPEHGVEMTHTVSFYRKDIVIDGTLYQKED